MADTLGIGRVGSIPVLNRTPSNTDRPTTEQALQASKRGNVRPVYYKGVKLRAEDTSKTETALQRQARKRIEHAQEYYEQYGSTENIGQRVTNRFWSLIGISTDVAYAPLERETLPADSYVDLSSEGEIREIMATREQVWGAMGNKSLEQAATLMRGAVTGKVKTASSAMVKSMLQGAAKTVAQEGAKKAGVAAVSAGLGVATGGASLAVQMAVSLAIDKGGKIIGKLREFAEPAIKMAVGVGSWALIQLSNFLASLGPLGGLLTSAGFGTGFLAGYAATGNVFIALGYGAAGGIGGAIWASTGVTMSGLASGASSLISSFTGGGALFTVSAPTLAVVGGGLAAITLTVGAIFAQFAASPEKFENQGPPTLFTVEKTARPTAVANLGNGFTANYTVTIKPKENKFLKLDSIIDETVAYTKSGPVTLSKKSISITQDQYEYSYSIDISADGLRNVDVLQNGVRKNAFDLLVAAKDFNIINTVTVVAVNSEQLSQSQHQVAEAVIKVGNPTDEAPYDFPIAGVIESIDSQDITIKGVTRPHCGTVGFPSRECLGGGLDIAGNANGTVRSTLDGIVKVSINDDDADYGLGGVVYILSMTGEYKAVFLHLNSSGLPAVNSVVKRGDSIGSVYKGVLPTTSGPHVHYQVLRGGANWSFANHVGTCGNGNLIPTAPAIDKSVFPTTFPPATLVCN